MDKSIRYIKMALLINDLISWIGCIYSFIIGQRSFSVYCGIIGIILSIIVLALENFDMRALANSIKAFKQTESSVLTFITVVICALSVFFMYYMERYVIIAYLTAASLIALISTVLTILIAAVFFKKDAAINHIGMNISFQIVALFVYFIRLVLAQSGIIGKIFSLIGILGFGPIVGIYCFIFWILEKIE